MAALSTKRKGALEGMSEAPDSDVVVTKGLVRIFGEGDAAVHALRGVDLNVARGELVAIMGPSGSGKSTLLSLLGAVDSPTEGEIFLDGESLAGRSDAELTLIRRTRIGFVFQSYNLLPGLTAEDNVALPLMLDGVDRGESKRRTDEVLERLAISHRRDHLPSMLSGGEQQRVAIGRALVTNPRLFLADEPTGNLDSNQGEEVTKLLRGLVDDTGQTVVVATHDAGVASQCDRVILLRDGRAVNHLAGNGVTADAIQAALRSNGP
jgi:putative ABC transport system ATP-binding protein